MIRTRSTLALALLGAVAFLVPATGTYALWSASATGMMTVSTAAAANLILECDGAQTPAPRYRVKWNSLGAGVSYEIQRAPDSQPTNFTTASNTPGTNYTETTWGNGTAYRFRVHATAGSTHLATSNTLRVARNGNSNNFSCEAP